VQIADRPQPVVVFLAGQDVVVANRGHGARAYLRRVQIECPCAD
jgi:hypothetical protein